MPIFEHIHFHDFLENDDAHNHESGHGAMAKTLKDDVVIFIKAGRDGNGIAGIDIRHFDEYSLYLIAVAGYLTEAGKRSGRHVDIETVEETIDQIVTIRKNKLDPRVNVKLEGDAETQASFSPDDFDWIDGDFNATLAKKAAREVAQRLKHDEVFNKHAKEIYSALANKGTYRNGI